jgi:phosphoribosylformimino-5-aminoimidazole carboxamide ribotide isomerase
MLIPSIDLRGGRIVQLVQGDRLALASDDLDGWIQRFARYPVVQLIDLDAALGTGSNADLVQTICARLPCRVGGGVRSAGAARALIDLGARNVIVGSALFRDGRPDLDAAARFSEAVGVERLIGAVDSRGGTVVIRGWTEKTMMTAADTVRSLEAYCGGFLYTHVDTEGLMAGIDFEAVEAVRRATTRRVTAAGGITTKEEIERLDRLGVDAVVGMAIYTGKLEV